MAYLLVQIDDTPEAKTYGMALVWISPLQARVSSMVEALEILSSLTSEGSDWPYICIQLYKGANHMPLPKDKHICVWPQEKAESLTGWTSQLKICWLLSTRPLVVFPIELNGGDQLETINLPESLHTGSSITTDEHPYIKVNIPMPILEEYDHISLPLGGKHDIPTINWFKTPWKPRVTIAAEVNDLLDQGMMGNYDQESEHSVMEEVPTTEADASPPLKTDITVLPLDTSSQTSAADMEVSVGSNPISILTTAATHSSQSSSPIAELSELQSDAHLAVHSIFTAKRSSDLEIQCAIQDFEASLHQLEAETTTTNIKAKVAHLRRDLRAKVKCAKAAIKAKYNYHMAIQEARTERCTELEELEATYSKAISKNVATQSLKACHTLLRTYRICAGIRNACLKGRELKSPALPGSTSSSPASSPAITQGKSPFFLLPSTGTIIIIPSIPYSHPCTSGGRAATLHYFSQTGTRKVSSPKEAALIHGCTGRHVNGQRFPHNFAGGTIKL